MKMTENLPQYFLSSALPVRAGHYYAHYLIYIDIDIYIICILFLSHIFCNLFFGHLKFVHIYVYIQIYTYCLHICVYICTYIDLAHSFLSTTSFFFI